MRSSFKRLSPRQTGTLQWRLQLEEVRELIDGAVALMIAVDDRGQVAGVVGALQQYRGHVWELHPLVVRQGLRRCGIGRSLVAQLEKAAISREISTIMLGTDDVRGQTSIGGRPIFPGVLNEAMHIQDLHGHAFAFYRAIGYEVIGVIPDANGAGKHDILMGKALSNPRVYTA